MKVKVFILVVIIVLISISAVDINVKTEGLLTGDKAPGIESLIKEQNNNSSQNPNSYYRLVNFWASYDANSRARNIRLSNIIEKSGSDKIVFYAVSVDESPSVFAETIRIDMLEQSNQLHAENGRESDLYRKYNLNKGLGNYLIDDKGVIIAKNITPEQLKQIIE